MICFIDYRSTTQEINNLKSLNLEIVKIPKCENLYDAINGHVDIQLNILSKENKLIIINKDLPRSFKETLERYKINYLESTNSLKRNYPLNISLNACISEQYLIHNILYTDPKLLELSKNRKIINVKQGYTKCSILPVREKAVITCDIGIHKTLTEKNFDVLLLPPGDIVLPGFNYGFIGGAGGMISDNTMAFFGSLDNYSFGNEVKSFLYKYDIKPYYLSNEKLQDRGSLLVL